MAAELEHLIHTYRERGLADAADRLAALQADLEAQGMLPPSLSDRTGGAELVRSASDPAEGAIATRVTYFAGGVRLGPRVSGRVDLSAHYDIDTLGLSRRHRNALLHAGISTLAEVQFFANHHLLDQVREIGQHGVQDIETHLSQLPVAAPPEG